MFEDKRENTGDQQNDTALSGASSGIQTNANHHTNQDNKHVIKLKSVRIKLLKKLRIAYIKMPTLLKKTAILMKRFARKSLKFLRFLPWKKIGIIALTVLFVAWLIIHFFFASTTRIINNLSYNYRTYQQIETKMNTINIEFNRLNNEGLSAIQTDLQELADITKDTRTSLPLKLFTTYAFRPEADIYSKHIDTLYQPANQPDTSQISNNSKVLAETSRLVEDILKRQDITKDTDGYASFMKDALIKLDALDNSDTVDLATTRKLFNYINEAVLVYQTSGDKVGFDARYSNLSSELTKELSLAWYQSNSNEYARVSAQRSTLEAIIKLNANKN